MHSALASTAGEFALFVLFPLAALLVIVGAPIGGLLIMSKGPRRLESMIQGACAAAKNSQAPLVRFRFRTYHGLLVFAVQTAHELVLPYPQARLLLEQLHRFNLTWGFFAYGAVIIPILSFFEYRSEWRRIQREAEGAPPADFR